MGHASDVFACQGGDLLLNVKIKDHEFFQREGSDVVSEVPLSLFEAIKGTQVTVQTIHGKITIQTEPGVCCGDSLVLQRFGVPEFDPPENYDPLDLRGDHIVRFKVLLPDFNPEGETKRDELIRQILEIEN
jgi:DnaJ-class molecular chaperone